MISRTLTCAVILLACASLQFAADGEKPVITSAFANAPRALTVAWAHNDNGVFGFAVQIKTEGEWRDVQHLDHTFGQTTLVFLEPDTTYTVRVCAVYGPDRESDLECSESEPAVRTMPLSSTTASGAAPTLTRSEVSENTIKIWWQSAAYGFFHVRWAEKGQGETQDQINSAGQSGYHEVNNLRPGTVYVFRMQGCNRTLFGSSCGSWGTPVEIRTALPPLQTPTLSVLPDDSSLYVKLQWGGGVDFTNTNLLLYRDGKVVHDARARTGMNNPHIDVVPRRNTEYSYVLCFVREEWKCSDPVKGTGKLTAPTAPVYISGARRRPFQTNVGQLPPVQLDLKWRNTEIPGQFIVVETLEFLETNGPPVVRWSEIGRINARKDPTEISIPLPETSTGRGTIPQSKTYRICSVVLPLGNAGKVCTPQFEVQ